MLFLIGPHEVLKVIYRLSLIYEDILDRPDGSKNVVFRLFNNGFESIGSSGLIQNHVVYRLSLIVEGILYGRTVRNMF